MKLDAVLLCACLLVARLCFAAPLAPGNAFFSPQISPDQRSYLWESLERDGSIWSTDREGENLTYLTRGHSPSWEGADSFRFVVSEDDGHEVLWQHLYRFDLEERRAELLVRDSDNPDYRTVSLAPPVPARPGRPLSGKVVCLDPGHGKNSGAYSAHTETYEDFYALRSAVLVKDLLEQSGATVRMARWDNESCPSLPARVNYSNSVSAALFCSLHYNSAGNQAAHGLEVFHRSYNSTSEEQARKVHDRMREATDLHSRGVKGDKEWLGFYLGVLSSRHQTDRRCLTEGAFLSNAGDAALVHQPSWNARLSWGIYAGICDTLGVEPVPRPDDEPERIVDGFLGGAGSRWSGSPARALATETPEGDGAALLLAAEAGRPVRLLTGGATWSDYGVSATARSAGDAPATFGLVAHGMTSDERHLIGFLLLVEEARSQATLYASFGDPSAATALGSVAVGPREDGWHQLRLSCRGGVVSAAVDGVELETSGETARLRRASPEVLRSGKAGLYLAAPRGPARLAVDRFELRPWARLQ